MKLPLDSYSLRARYLPAVLVLAPAFAAAAAWVPFESLAWKLLASLGALAAAAVLLSHLARDLGRRKQPHLFKLLGGMPTTRFLRHRDPTLNPQTRDRYHAKLATLVPGIKMPSPRKEKANPDAADEAYVTCGDWLREQTRDREKFGLLFEENVSFGFRRNLWAMKPAGIALALLGAAAGALHLASDVLASRSPAPESIIATVLGACLLTWWLLRIRMRWVADAADAYGRSLLAACDQI